jgi:hypothetical protein
MGKIREKYPSKVFIMMSGISAYEKRSKREGADTFLAKLFEINDLFSIVQCYVIESR